MAKGRIYTSTFNVAAQTAVQDLFQLLAATNVQVEVLEIKITFGAGTDERARIMGHFGSTNGSGGSIPTPRARDQGMPAADTVVEANNTTQATNGNIVIDEIHDLRTKFHWLPTPETQILIAGGDLFHLSLEDAITSTEISGEITFEERG